MHYPLSLLLYLLNQKENFVCLLAFVTIADNNNLSAVPSPRGNLVGWASGVRRKFSWGGFKVPKFFFALKSKV